MQRTGLLLIFVLSAALLPAAGGCGPAEQAWPTTAPDTLRPVALAGGERLRVVATSSIVGDVVGRVGGDRIELKTLIGRGVDPHSYSPTPRQTAAVYDAHVLFASGAGLEVFLAKMLANAGGSAARVDMSGGLALRTLQAEHGHAAEPDPHVWFDVRNVIEWVAVAEKTLSALDPAGQPTYAANALAYRRELEALDAWVVDQVKAVPDARRKLVINHPVLGYFAGRYGFEQVGAVYPLSPSAEPSAQDVAALEKAIREFDVPAVLTENTVSPRLAEQVSHDTGVKLVRLFTDSLGLPGSGGETYLDLMRYDVSAIVEALK